MLLQLPQFARRQTLGRNENGRKADSSYHILPFYFYYLHYIQCNDRLAS